MTCVCKSICDRFEIITEVGNKYDQKRQVRRCQHCEIWFYYDGKYCPCCGQHLRANSRYKTKKQKENRQYIDPVSVETS